MLAEARAAAEADGKAGWKLTLRMPCYLPVMSYADNRALRATLHRAYATRASDLGASPRGTTPRSSGASCVLRREAAQLLGYPNFAELSLVPKMAQSVDEVLAFLRDLARRAKPFAERDYAELAAFAAAELGIADLAAVGPSRYASEKLKARSFAFSGAGGAPLFSRRTRCWRDCSVWRRRSTASRSARARRATWHPDVRFFDVMRSRRAR